MGEGVDQQVPKKTSRHGIIRMGMGRRGTQWARLGKGWNVMPPRHRESKGLWREGSRRGCATGGRRKSRPEHLPADQNGIWGMPGAVECGVHVSTVGTGGQLAQAKQLIPARPEVVEERQGRTDVGFRVERDKRTSM